MSEEPTAAAHPRPRPRRARLVVLASVMAVCAAGLMTGGEPGTDEGINVSPIKVGNCVAAAASMDPRPHRRVPCGDPSATYVVLARFAAADTDRCRDVPGVTVLYPVGGKALCLGKKGVDPATAANVAKVGDCVELHMTGLSSFDDLLLRDCAEARFRVVARLTDVPKSQRHPCRGVPHYEISHEWNWDGLSTFDPRSKQTIDVILCLART